MKNNHQIIEKMAQVINIANEDKKPRDYGTGHLLYHSEIHMIGAIRNHPQVNANELAGILGVTNGAVNQMASKLIKKGFVETYRLNGNRKEVYYKLTGLGETAYEGHEKHHAGIHGSLLQYLDELDEEKVETITHCLDKFIEGMSQK